LTYTKLESREYTFDEIMCFDDPEWLVEGFVEESSCIFVSAQPKVGKSFLALRLAAAVSSGTDLFGFNAKQGHVLYLAAERAHLMKRRLQALTLRGIPLDRNHFRMWPDPVMFADHEAVTNFVKALTVTPDLLIVDTLRRCNDGDERDNTHMGLWTKGIEEFRELTGASVVVIHHDHKAQHNSYGRAMETTFSGAGSILGNLDGYFSVRPQQNGTIVITSEGSNELNGFHVTTRIENQVIGVNSDGRTRSSGVMVHIDADGVIEEPKPRLENVVEDVIKANPNSDLRTIANQTRELEVVQQHWPNLDNTSVGRIVNQFESEGKVYKAPHPKHAQKYQVVWIDEEQTTAA
jgi:hypothetical protein